jgi:glycerol-3-phosphate acyltransferase PlsY
MMAIQQLSQFLVPVCVVTAAYLTGCFCSGYYLFRFKTGKDIREMGSGTAGAMNTGRLLGKTGFAVAFAGDFAKGAVVVFAAKCLTSSPWLESLAMVAVILGHMYPVQLGFHGGKGLAAFAGAMLIININLVLVSCAVLALAGVITKRYKMWCMLILAGLPFAGALVVTERGYIAGITVGALLVLFGHRKDIRAMIKSVSDDLATKEVVSGGDS